MAKSKTRLSELEAFEVSLVKSGANNKKFLLLKSQEGGMQKLLEQVMKCNLENEAELDTKILDLAPEEIKKDDAGLEEFKSAVKGAIRLLKSIDSDKLDQVSLASLLTKQVKKENPEEVINKTGDNKEPGVEIMPENKPEEVKKEEVTPSAVDSKIEAIYKANQELVQKNADLEKKLDVERQVRIQKEFDDKAADFKNLPGESADLSLVLKEASEKLGKESFEKLETILKASDTAIGEGELLKEVGSGGFDGGGSAWTKIEKAAEKVQADKPSLSSAQAVDLVLKNNRGLYNDYMNEKEGVQ